MCVSKGLTGGYLPLSLVITTNEIYNAFYDDYEKLKSFLHSHSYSGNPLACSVAIETLNIFKEENILDKLKHKSKYLKNSVENLFKDLDYVGEIRSMGMICAIELVKDKKSKEPFDFKDRIGYKIYKIALENSLILRPLGNVLYFMPPYVITNQQIDEMTNIALFSYKKFFK